MIRNMLIALALLAVWSGCSPACQEAEDLCKECELATDKCESLYDDASNEFCEQAVEVYETSCGE